MERHIMENLRTTFLVVTNMLKQRIATILTRYRYRRYSTETKAIQTIHDQFDKYAQHLENRAGRKRSHVNIIVGMSGGVDSSVTAALLKDHGFNVRGLMMQNWDEEDDDCSKTGTNCPTLSQDWFDVKSVCDSIGVSHVKDHPVRFVQEYWNNVFAKSLEQYERGLTPNPDLLCNEFVKFDAMLNLARDGYNADYIATGHYAQIDAQTRLQQAVDGTKDQSYFLAFVNKLAFQHTVFPLGGLLKKEHVRPLAKYYNLPEQVATKRDSVGICFVGKQRKFSDFLSQFIHKKRGNIISILDGSVVGKHDGISFYTIGERAKFDGKFDKWYICRKDVKNNILYACPADHESLLSSTFFITNCKWITEPSPQKQLFVKVRYRSQAVPCRVKIQGDMVQVTLDAPLKAITSGQAAVFYEPSENCEQMICLGGGVIIANELT